MPSPDWITIPAPIVTTIPDPTCTCAQDADDEHMDFCSSLDPEEYETFVDESLALADVFLDALEAHTLTHEAPTYRHLIEAFRFLRWHMEQELAEALEGDDADDEEA